MVRKPWDPIDADQTQFMQANADKISTATIPVVDNANAPGGSSPGIPSSPTPITTTPKDTTAILPTDPSNPQSYQNMNKAGVMAGWVDYYNPQNEDVILKGMFAGTPLSVKSPVIDKARERFAKYNVLSSITPEQLGDSILSGKIWVWSTELTDLKNYNPELYWQTTQYITNKKNMNEINDMGMWYYNALMKWTPTSNKIKYDVSTEAPTSDIMTAYNQKIQDMVVSKFWPNAEKWYWLTQELLNNPQVQQQKATITSLEWKKNKLNEDIFNLDSEVRKTLGAEAPEALISAYIWEQTKAISKSLRTVDNELAVEQANLENYLNEVNTTLDYIKTWWDQDIKKKTGWSWSAQLWSWVEALYNDRKNGAILDQEITNQTIRNKYGLKGKSRAEVLQALAELTANEWDIATADDLIGRAWWDYWKSYQEMTKELLAKNKWVETAKYIKNKYSGDKRIKALTSIFGKSDVSKLSDTLSQAGYWWFSWKNKAVKAVKKAQWL